MMRTILMLALLLGLCTTADAGDWMCPHNNASYSGLIIGCGGYAQTRRDGEVTSQARIEYDYSPNKQEPPLPPLLLSTQPYGKTEVSVYRPAGGAGVGAEMKIFAYNVARWKGIPIVGSVSYPNIILDGKVEADGYASNDTPPSYEATGTGFFGGIIYRTYKNVSGQQKMAKGLLQPYATYGPKSGGDPIVAPSPRAGYVICLFGDNDIKAVWNDQTKKWRVERKLRDINGNWLNGGNPIIEDKDTLTTAYWAHYPVAADGECETYVSLGQPRDVREDDIGQWKTENKLDAACVSPGQTGMQQSRSERWRVRGLVYFWHPGVISQ